MHVISRCPACRQIVDAAQRTCPHCAAKLTRAKFKFGSVLLYGALIILLAVIVSVIIVPITAIAVVVALFTRQNLHVVSFGNDNKEPPAAGKGRVINMPSSD